MQERSEMEREIERMERLLETSTPSRRQVVFGGLALFGTALLGGGAWLKRQADKRAFAEQLHEEVQEIKKRCILETPLIAELEKHKDLVEKVHKDTGVPRYFLYGMFEFKKRAGWWHSGMHWNGSVSSGEGVVPVNCKKVGIRIEAMNKDPEQSLRASAKEYQAQFRRYGDEIVTVASIVQEHLQSFEERYPAAVKDADEVNRYRVRHLKMKKDPHLAIIEELVQECYRLVEINHVPYDPSKHNWYGPEIKDEAANAKQRALETKISELVQKRIGNSHDRFKAYLAHLHYWERKRWWVNNLATASDIRAVLKLRYLENGKL
jgi:hypothetical protein